MAGLTRGYQVPGTICLFLSATAAHGVSFAFALRVPVTRSISSSFLFVSSQVWKNKRGKGRIVHVSAGLGGSSTVGTLLFGEAMGFRQHYKSRRYGTPDSSS